MSASSASTTPQTVSQFHTAFEEWRTSMDEVSLEGLNSGGAQKSEYLSALTQTTDNVEQEIEHSKVHWSEVKGCATLANDDVDVVIRENRKFFQELQNDPQWIINGQFLWRGWDHFFTSWGSGWKLGKKIAEGGQAEIFEIDGCNYFLLKVFKKELQLSQLREQWPQGVLQYKVLNIVGWGTMLSDDRFAFIMLRCWGDLRKLIDQIMHQKNHQGSPFPYEWDGQTVHAKYLMREIARRMCKLHENGILHRDLKASNILLKRFSDLPFVLVADFECSIGVVGTTFWRAPEILLALKKREDIDFSMKVDVYSYGMTCFEIVTGLLPFEGELKPSRASYDLVIAGERPKLPSHLDVRWKDLIQKCWDQDPTQRPTFVEIVEMIDKLESDSFRREQL